MRKLVAVGSVLLGLGLSAVGLAQSRSGVDLDRGAELFDLCVQCHGPEGGGMEMALAPAIAGLDEWYVAAQLRVFKSGARGTHPDDMGGLRMHPMALSLKTDEEIDSVAAYVASLPRADTVPVLQGDASRGQTLYAPCAACHGADAGGNKALNAPRLQGASDWYLLSSLQKYKARIRGGNPANTNAMIMVGMASTLPDEQAMRDVVAYITTLDGSGKQGSR